LDPDEPLSPRSADAARPPLVLASTSPYRRRLVERLGVPFEAVSPAFDEEDARARLCAEGAAPAALALGLARGKAQAARRLHPDALVVGADQLVALDDVVLGKPHDPDGARRQLQRLAGRSHALLTAFCMLGPEGLQHEHVDRTRLTMRTLDPAEIETYLALDEPYDCAGSYKIEAHGVTLFDAIQSEDATAIEGLPLLTLARTLRTVGLCVPTAIPAGGS